VYAFTRNSTLGVDLEVVRPIADLDGIAEYFFSPRELASLRALGPHERTAGFFNCWTRKEAYIKAVGGGLSIPLKSINTDGWSVIDLCPRDGYVGAVAVEGGPWILRTLEFNWLHASDR
jgi:4'-phosphopantetheinyl transferase